MWRHEAARRSPHCLATARRTTPWHKPRHMQQGALASPAFPSLLPASRRDRNPASAETPGPHEYDMTPRAQPDRPTVTPTDTPTTLTTPAHRDHNAHPHDHPLSTRASPDHNRTLARRHVNQNGNAHRGPAPGRPHSAPFASACVPPCPSVPASCVCTGERVRLNAFD